MAYSIDTTHPIWRVTFSGALTSDDIRNILNDARSIEKAAPVPRDRIVDCRSLQSIEIGYSEFSYFASERRKDNFDRPIKTAIVTGNRFQYGFARMFQSLLEHPQIEVAIFDDENKALAWLSQPGTRTIADEQNQ